MRAARVRAPGNSPSHLGPPKARISGLVWARRAPLMLMMRAPAVRIMRSRPRAEAASSNLLAAPRRPKTCPNATRNARAFRSHSPANFEFPASVPATPQGRASRALAGPSRRGEGGSAASCRPRFFLYGFARLWRPKAAATEGARCAARFLL